MRASRKKAMAAESPAAMVAASFCPSRQGEVLDHQQPQPAQHVQREEKYQSAFSELHQRLIAPAQEAFERRFAADGEAEGEKMHRQENSEPQAGQPVHERGDPKHALAVPQVAQVHGSTTATTARAPSKNSRTPKTPASMPAPRSSSGDHSARTLRTPIVA